MSLSIAQHIVDDITEGQFPPGTKLEAEREMMARFASSRGTLRESLRFLEMNGVITVEEGPHGGRVVSEPDAHDLAGLLGLFLQLRAVRFKSLVLAREILEPELAALAAENADDDILAEIADSIAEMECHLDDEQNFVAENARFHSLLARAVGNELLGLLISSLHLITDGMLGISYSIDCRKAVPRAHQAVYDALRTRDGEGARWAMRRHLREFRSHVEEQFPTTYQQPVRWRDLTSRC